MTRKCAIKERELYFTLKIAFSIIYDVVPHSFAVSEPVLAEHSKTMIENHEFTCLPLDGAKVRTLTHSVPSIFDVFYNINIKNGWN